MNLMERIFAISHRKFNADGTLKAFPFEDPTGINKLLKS